MKNGKVSVIIPVYNAEKYIENMLKDLLSQSYSDMEIIVIDDGSSDNSWEIIQQYSESDSRIIACKIRNGGPSKARNRGLELATGEYIRFLDADDRITVDSMKLLIKPYISLEGIDLVFGNYICKPDKNYFKGDIFKTGEVPYERFIIHFIKFCKSFYFGAPWNKLYKRDIIETNHIRFDEDIRWCEDFIFNVQYYSHCKRIYYVNAQQGVYQYCIRDDGITAEIEKEDCEIDIEYIDSLRYKIAYEFCKSNGKENFFAAEWDNASLYALLSASTKRKFNKSFIKRYKEFCRLLKKKGVYEYVCSRQEEFDLKVWKDIKLAIEKDSYLKPFLFFYFKGFMATYFEPIMPFLRKIIQPFLPKSL